MLVNYIARGAALLAGFVFQLYAINFLGQEGYGKFVTVLALVSVFSAFTRLGYENYLMDKGFDSADRSLKLFLLLFSIISPLVLYVVTAIFNFPLIFLLLVPFQTLFVISMEACKRHGRLLTAQLGILTASNLFSLAFMELFLSSDEATYLTVLWVYCGFQALSVVFWPKHFLMDILKMGGYRKFDLCDIGSAISGTKSFSGLTIINVVWANIDVLIVSYMLGPISSGQYFISSKIANLVGVALVLSNLKSSPSMRKSTEGYESYFTKDARRDLLTQTFIVFLVVVAATYIVPEKYNLSIGVVLILAVAHIITAYIGPVGQYAVIHSKSKLAMKGIASGTFLNGVLSIFLSQFIGIIGVAIATLIGQSAWRGILRRHIDDA